VQLIACMPAVFQPLGSRANRGSVIAAPTRGRFAITQIRSRHISPKNRQIGTDARALGAHGCPKALLARRPIRGLSGRPHTPAKPAKTRMPQRDKRRANPGAPWSRDESPRGAEEKGCLVLPAAAGAAATATTCAAATTPAGAAATATTCAAATTAAGAAAADGHCPDAVLDHDPHPIAESGAAAI